MRLDGVDGTVVDGAFSSVIIGGRVPDFTSMIVFSPHRKPGWEVDDRVVRPGISLSASW